MADYSDYLNYLCHVDDTTLSEFKKKEDELRHQIDVIRDRYQREISDIKERTTAEKAQLQADKNAVISQLKKDHKIALETAMSNAETKRQAEEQKLLGKIKTLESAHQLEVASLKQKMVSNAETAKKAYEILQTETENSLKQVRSEYEERIKKLKADNDNVLKEFKTKYEGLLQQKDADSSALIKKHNQERIEWCAKQDKMIEVLTQQYEEKLKGIAVQLQKAKDEIKDKESEWDKRIQDVNQSWRQKLKDLQDSVNGASAVSSQENYEHQISDLNQDLCVLKDNNKILNSEKKSLLAQNEELKRRMDELVNQNNAQADRVKELEAGIPIMDSKNGLLIFLIITVIAIGILICYLL